MHTVRIQTAQNVGIDVEVAGVGDRILAAVVDYLILGAYAVGAVILLSSLDVNTVAVWVLFGLPYLLYFPLSEIFLDGQSIGKRLLQIKVVRLDGTQPTVGNYVIRWLLRFVDIAMFSGLVAVVVILINGKGQRLGDIAAGTTVVKTKPRVRLDDTIFTRVEEAHTLAFPQVEHLAPEDVATAREVVQALLEDKTSHTTFTLGNKMKHTLERKMGVTSDLAPLAFLRTIIQDYNHLRGRVE